MVILCCTCKFFYYIVSARRVFYKCKCPDAPTKDFVYGNRHCQDINTDGKCEFFKERENKGE